MKCESCGLSGPLYEVIIFDGIHRIMNYCKDCIKAMRWRMA
jgi:hypothetical protein